MSFRAEDHFMKVKGNDYLPTVWRVVWLREEHPCAQIDTEVVWWDHDKQEIMVRAQVVLPKTGARATGHCVGSLADFKFGYVEKAETQAVGRALALLGYGTAFAGQDLEEGERGAESPVQQVATPAAKGAGATSSTPLVHAAAHSPRNDHAQEARPKTQQTTPQQALPTDCAGLKRLLEQASGLALSKISQCNDLAHTYGASELRSKDDLTRAWMIDLLGRINAAKARDAEQYRTRILGATTPEEVSDALAEAFKAHQRGTLSSESAEELADLADARDEELRRHLAAQESESAAQQSQAHLAQAAS